MTDTTHNQDPRITAALAAAQARGESELQVAEGGGS
jgi:hypothetical protein